MAERRVRLDDLGAWLIKGNADRADLPARFAADPHVASWCVQPGYRARLMAAGRLGPAHAAARGPRLAGAEVFRRPQAGNPSFLTRAELRALEEYLDAPQL